MAITFTHEDLDELEAIATQGVHDIDRTVQLLDRLEGTLAKVLRLIREERAGEDDE
jgi:hypothetical protein